MDFHFNRGFTYYKGFKSQEELREYNKKTGDLPDCESFKYLKPGDELLATNGFIAVEDFDDEVWAEIPDTLKEALN